MILKQVGLILLVSLAMWLTSCATIMSGTEQTITITSTPPGARVSVGHQQSFTPVSVIIPKGIDIPIEVSQGPDRRVVALNREIDPVFWLNFIPPLWPGFIIDAVSGAITHYTPNVVHIDFRADPPSSYVHTVHYKP